MTQKEALDWNKIRKQAGPYPLEAFDFVRSGLSYTIERFRSEQPEEPEDHHISGQELCLGLRDYAIDQYGLLALTVFEHWSIRRTEDFGRIVYAMVDFGLMSKTDDDSPEDFRAVYDFTEAFSRDQILSRTTTG